MDHRAGFAMHDSTGGPDDIPTKGPADTLVSHANTKEREVRAQFRDSLERDARLFGGSRAGRDEDSGRVHRSDVRDGAGVVGDDDVGAAEVAEVLVRFFLGGGERGREVRLGRRKRNCGDETSFSRAVAHALFFLFSLLFNNIDSPDTGCT